FKAEPYYGFEEVEVTIGHGDKVVGHYTDWLEEKGPSGLKVKEYIEKKLYDFFDDLIYDTEVPEDLYPTTYVEERTIAFLKRFTDGKYDKENFFLQCSFPDPHHPICPPGKYKDMYQPENIELPKTFKDLENLKKAKHPFLSRFLDKEMFSRALLRQNNEEETRRFLAGTFGAVSMVDNSIGNILTALDELGLAENTIVVYTSDHGDLAGDHGMCLKGPCPFSGILRVPMIWKVPGITPNGAVSDSLMSSIDISRTFLSLVDIKERRQPEHMQGLDFTPVLKDSKVKVRDHCYIEEDEERQSKMRVRHLITETHKLTVYEGIEDYGDIYDLKNDPDELHNLWFEDEKLRIKLMNKLFHVSLSAAPRLPKRQALT
ncbi:MAG: sulfatase-like hydrolase/transferase, partial [archaeon]|nr:sulfatase-like hydrolase/transferase [archaeon]